MARARPRAGASGSHASSPGTYAIATEVAPSVPDPPVTKARPSSQQHGARIRARPGGAVTAVHAPSSRRRGRRGARRRRRPQGPRRRDGRRRPARCRPPVGRRTARRRWPAPTAGRRYPTTGRWRDRRSRRRDLNRRGGRGEEVAGRATDLEDTPVLEGDEVRVPGSAVQRAVLRPGVRLGSTLGRGAQDHRVASRGEDVHHPAHRRVPGLVLARLAAGRRVGVEPVGDVPRGRTGRRCRRDRHQSRRPIGGRSCARRRPSCDSVSSIVPHL